MSYPRDMLGYGATPPKADWPGKAKVAVQFVVNYEEGGERSVLHGDGESEAFLSEIVGAEPWPGMRHWNMESIYEYGARAGFWRLHRLFTTKRIPVTVFGVATALERGPAQVEAMRDAGWEIASHGLKWIDYRDYSFDDERAEMERAVRLHEMVTGEPPRGWYTGRCSANTVDIATQMGVFDYVSDSYADDLPYWYYRGGRDQLIIPYTLDANDMRFATPQGFNAGDQFFNYLKDTFDVLYTEGKAGQPKMMNIGLHCRLAGRPGRLAALDRFIKYAKRRKDVWFPRRIDIAEHWQAVHPPIPHHKEPHLMSRSDFIERFGGVFEDSSWIAEWAYEAGLAPAHATSGGLFLAMALQFRGASRDRRLGVLQAHPDLAGKLAQAKRLTPESAQEQAGAGLDALTDDQHQQFTICNSAYRTQFGFPFIIAVKGLNAGHILDQFRTRMQNDADTEFATACREVEKIARFRLNTLFKEED